MTEPLLHLLDLFLFLCFSFSFLLSFHQNLPIFLTIFSSKPPSLSYYLFIKTSLSFLLSFSQNLPLFLTFFFSKPLFLFSSYSLSLFGLWALNKQILYILTPPLTLSVHDSDTGCPDILSYSRPLKSKTDRK